VTLGVTAVDEMIAERLRCLGKPVLLAVNKVDSVDRLALVAEFWELRLGEPLPISAVHGTGTGDLLSTAVAACARAAADAPPPLDPAAGDAEAPLLRPLHVALVGRPNAGKSSLLNRLLGAERTAVSPTAGTTRDSVSAELLWRQQTLVLVDTAGLRKRATERGGTDADGRAQSAAARCVRDATVALCLFDAELGMTQHDISVLQSCIDEGRSVVLCANKWDAASAAGQRWGEVEAQLRRSLPNLEHVPILPISAATGEGLDRALSKAVEVAKGRAGRVPTAELNEAIAHAIARQPPPRGCSVRHAIQADAEVPTFVLFTRGPPTPSSYLRYLERCIREQIAFEGTPVRLMCKTDSGARARGAVRAAWAGGGGRGTPSVSQERHGRRGPRLGGPGGAGRGSELPSRRKC
jgi:GTP-binding protein